MVLNISVAQMTDMQNLFVETPSLKMARRYSATSMRCRYGTLDVDTNFFHVLERHTLHTTKNNKDKSIFTGTPADVQRLIKAAWNAPSSQYDDTSDHASKKIEMQWTCGETVGTTTKGLPTCRLKLVVGYRQRATKRATELSPVLITAFPIP